MKMSIFFRILTATLFPVILVLAIVIAIAINVIYQEYGSLSISVGKIAAAGVLGVLLLALCVFISARSIAGHVRRITESFNSAVSGGIEDTLGGKHIPTHKTNVVELDTLQDALVCMMVHLRRAHGHKLKAVEAEVEKEKLIASAQAKINFFAAMSHEIRTPMNAILGISEIVLLEGGLTPTQQKYMQDIKISSDALLNIINDVLDISKLETGKMELREEHYNFRALIDNVRSLATHLSEEADLKFIFEPHGKLPLCLYGDGTRVRQILLNLIGNAVKYTREGYVLLRVRVQDDTVRFDVSDSGIGINENEIGTIFESFKRIDTKRNWEVKGTGLGLSISKNLVELMGGEITVKSIYDKGSTFSVTIPLVLGDEEKLRPAKSYKGAQYSDTLRVLVVDDDETNLNVSSGLLRAAHGIRCDTALSGWEAIDMVQETDYDIIFMDYMMPELDGMDTTKHIRRLGSKYRQIPIIALTANAMIATRKELMDGGMNDYLAKPIRSDRLQEVLDTWVPEEKQLSSADSDTGAAASSGFSAVEYGTVLASVPERHLLEEEGVSLLVGLENIGFDEQMYLHSLRLFQGKLLHTVELLGKLLKQQRLGDFRVHVHGLKGSLANLGAVPISNDAKWLEAAAEKGNAEYCRALFPSFSDKLRRLHAALEKALPRTKQNGTSAPFDRTKFRDSLARLSAALDSYNYETIIKEIGIISGMEHDPQKRNDVLQIKRLAENFDYPAAATLIRKLL